MILLNYDVSLIVQRSKSSIYRDKSVLGTQKIVKIDNIGDATDKTRSLDNVRITAKESQDQQPEWLYLRPSS